jgi:hypothetical protein
MNHAIALPIEASCGHLVVLFRREGPSAHPADLDREVVQQEPARPTSRGSAARKRLDHDRLINGVLRAERLAGATAHILATECHCLAAGPDEDGCTGKGSVRSPALVA